MDERIHKGGRPMSQAMQERFRRIDERLTMLEASQGALHRALEHPAGRAVDAPALPDELQGLVLLLRAVGLNDALRKNFQALFVDILEAGLPSDERELSHFLQDLRSLHQHDVIDRKTWRRMEEQRQESVHGAANS